jgi:hypothetical protein
MSQLKGIPLVAEGAHARSGEKYLTPQGFTAVRDGIKAHAAQAAGETLPSVPTSVSAGTPVRRP